MPREMERAMGGYDYTGASRQRMYRQRQKRRQYAAKRMSLAVDRIIAAGGGGRPQDVRWMHAWRRAAGIADPRCGGAGES